MRQLWKRWHQFSKGFSSESVLGIPQIWNFGKTLKKEIWSNESDEAPLKNVALISETQFISSIMKMTNSKMLFFIFVWDFSLWSIVWRNRLKWILRFLLWNQLFALFEKAFIVSFFEDWTDPIDKGRSFGFIPILKTVDCSWLHCFVNFSLTISYIFQLERL